MREPPFRVAAIDHVELFVPDQHEAAVWYRRVLGLEVVRDLEHWSADGPLMLATASGAGMLALFRGVPGPRGDRTPGFRRVAFRVDGDAFTAFLGRLADLELEAQTGGRLRATDVVDHGEAWSIYFRDPWGHSLEVTTYEPDRVQLPG